ncbi:MAG: hypothetical protein EZS28_037945 [Streblomastix strix]|uniref:Uncharacterized protein n=1 Tax=Streblomastix strix TaxID=222440 RepID=A0A5J4U7F6_9EUKA|nr:MAG: hypothetical protein EZS28_037945 [Streblomastix strix]
MYYQQTKNERKKMGMISKTIIVLYSLEWMRMMIYMNLEGFETEVAVVITTVTLIAVVSASVYGDVVYGISNYAVIMQTQKILIQKIEFKKMKMKMTIQINNADGRLVYEDYNVLSYDKAGLLKLLLKLYLTTPYIYFGYDVTTDVAVSSVFAVCDEIADVALCGENAVYLEYGEKILDSKEGGER